MRRPVPKLLPLLLGACQPSLQYQPRLKAYERSEFFPDKRGSRDLPEGTLPRDSALHASPTGSSPPAANFSQPGLPAKLERSFLKRGKERFQIYCAVCHGLTGQGDGLVVQRGFPRPPSFHEERLRRAEPAYFVQVITQGFGLMYPYGGRVPPQDRWAIAAYIKALQLSQNQSIDALSADERRKLEAEP